MHTHTYIYISIRYDIGIYLVDVFLMDLQCKMDTVSISRWCDRSLYLHCVGYEVLDCVASSLATSSRASGSANRLLLLQLPRAAAHFTVVSRVGETVTSVERVSMHWRCATTLITTLDSAVGYLLLNGPRWLLTMLYSLPKP